MSVARGQDAGSPQEGAASATVDARTGLVTIGRTAVAAILEVQEALTRGFQDCSLTYNELLEENRAIAERIERMQRHVEEVLERADSLEQKAARAEARLAEITDRLSDAASRLILTGRLELADLVINTKTEGADDGS